MTSTSPATSSPTGSGNTPPASRAEPAMMEAITQRRYGGPEQWQLGKLPVPTIADNEVLVEVHGAGLDRGTWHVMTGSPWLARPFFGLRRLRRPVPGYDVAGVVAAIGKAVTRFQPGDRVFGIARGSFAEYAPAREAKLALLPAEVGFGQGGVLAVSGLTALQALDRAGEPGPDHRVLVIGASGGVGSYTVQLAVAAGSEVTAVCRGSKADLVRALGAHDVVDHLTDDVTTSDRRWDVIFDIGGRAPVARLRSILTERGTLVLVGGEGGGPVTGGMGRQLLAAARSPFLSQRIVSHLSSENHQDMARLAELVVAGAVTPAVEASFPLAQAASAMRHLESGEARGKIAIEVRPSSSG